MILAGERDVVVLDSASGETRWRTSVDGISEVAPSETVLAVRSADLRGFGLADGNLEWLLTRADAPARSLSATDSSIVGIEQWREEGVGELASLATDDGGVYAASLRGVVAALP